jgi:hypothetical protein
VSAVEDGPRRRAFIVHRIVAQRLQSAPVAPVGACSSSQPPSATPPAWPGPARPGLACAYLASCLARAPPRKSFCCAAAASPGARWAWRRSASARRVAAGRCEGGRGHVSGRRLQPLAGAAAMSGASACSSRSSRRQAPPGPARALEQSRTLLQRRPVKRGQSAPTVRPSSTWVSSHARRAASSSANVMNPKPRGLPVTRSRITIWRAAAGRAGAVEFERARVQQGGGILRCGAQYAYCRRRRHVPAPPRWAPLTGTHHLCYLSILSEVLL